MTINKEKVKKLFLQYFAITLGAAIMSMGFVLFIDPYNIVPGGFIAVGMILNNIWDGITVGEYHLYLNIPIFLIGLKFLGPRFGINTIVGILLISFFIDSFTLLAENYFENPTDPLGLGSDLLLSCIFGSILVGGGLGIIFRTGASTGGADIVAMLIAKFGRIPIGQAVMVTDVVIVLSAVFVFEDWSVPLYSMLSIYIIGQSINIVMSGFKYDNVLFIISEKHEEIKEKIINDFDRGGTFLKGEGMYTGNEKNVIFLVLTRRELPVIKAYIRHADPDAFITILDSRQTLGEGFNSIHEEVEP